MEKVTIERLKRNDESKIIIYFGLPTIGTVNRPSKVSNSVCAMVKDPDTLIIIKASRSTTEHYAIQDIGFTLHSPSYREHYDISINDYNELFGEGNWIKVWLDDDDYFELKRDCELITDSGADARQEGSWRSTGHRD